MKKRIIVIGRQFGSGGHEVGERLAEKLGIPLYDRELVKAAAEKLNTAEDKLSESDEKALSEFVIAYQAGRRARNSREFPEYMDDCCDKVFKQQSLLIKEWAQKGSCVIVGRCADYILRERTDVFTVFIRSDKDSRKERLMDIYGISAQEAKKEIQKKDKERKQYYRQHTGLKWGSSKNYDMILNAENLDIEEMVQILSVVCE